MASGLFSQGNEAFVDEDYDLAIKCYSDAISIETDNSNFYSKRGMAYMKANKYEEALVDFNRAVQLDSSKWNAHFKKGQAYFSLSQFSQAKVSFQEALTLNGTEETLLTWIKKCDAELGDAQMKTKDGCNDAAQTAVVENSDIKTNTEQAQDSTADKQSTTQKPPPKARYDWYQTDTHVVLSILVKNAKAEDVHVDISEQNLSATIRLPSGSDYNLELDLAHPIVTNQSGSKVLSTKIEIKLKKLEGIRWSSLETDNESSYASRPMASAAASTSVSEGETAVKRYPSSSRHYHDWDKVAADIAKEEKEEKLDGEAGLNKMFQGIYSDGSDEVRRAMNKSFVESGGTVLSTNWKDIGKKKVDCKPPDGMEYKKYEM